MARITVEDCIDKFESRFELVLVASNRARKIHSGESPTVDKNNDKPTVIALREIAIETLPIDSLKNNLIQEYQTVAPLDEEELSLDYSGSENVIKEEIIEDEGELSNLIDGDKNFKDENKSEEDNNDSILAPKNDEYNDISDDKNPENQ